jgi:hypothetical protein
MGAGCRVLCDMMAILSVTHAQEDPVCRYTLTPSIRSRRKPGEWLAPPSPAATHTWTYSTERAIAHHKLYHFAEKGFTASVGSYDNFRYLWEPALLGQIWGDTDSVAGDFSAERPGSEGKAAIRTGLEKTYDV